MRQHLGLDAVEALQAVGDVARGREDAARLAERDAVEPLDRAARRAILGAVGELAELGAVVVVCLPELMQHPGDLVRVADAVGGELRRDHAVDRPPVGLGQVDEPPEERLVEHARAGVPLERHRHELGLVAARTQRVDEVLRHQLRPAPHERHLRRADRDSHFDSSRWMRSSRSSISFSTASLNARWSANAGSTYQRIMRRRNGLQRPALADDRPLGRDRPEPLGLVAHREAHLRGRHVGRPRAGGAHLLLQLGEEGGDIGFLAHSAGV